MNNDIVSKFQKRKDIDFFFCLFNISPHKKPKFGGIFYKGNTSRLKKALII